MRSPEVAIIWPVYIYTHDGLPSFQEEKSIQTCVYMWICIRIYIYDINCPPFIVEKIYHLYLDFTCLLKENGDMEPHHQHHSQPQKVGPHLWDSFCWCCLQGWSMEIQGIDPSTLEIPWEFNPKIPGNPEVLTCHRNELSFFSKKQRKCDMWILFGPSKIKGEWVLRFLGETMLSWIGGWDVFRGLKVVLKRVEG